MNEDTLIIKCSSCNSSLLEIWLGKKNKEKTTKITCDCYKCGDSSFATNIQGEFYISSSDGCKVSGSSTKDNGTMSIQTTEG